MRVHPNNRWVAVLGMADTKLKQKRANAKWATLRVDETAEALGVPTQQVRETGRHVFRVPVGVPVDRTEDDGD